MTARAKSIVGNIGLAVFMTAWFFGAIALAAGIEGPWQ